MATGNNKKPKEDLQGDSFDSSSTNVDVEDEFPVLPIADLPKKYQDMFTDFLSHLNNKKPQEARIALRPLIAYYIEQKREIPLSVEVGYGKLLVLEELKKLGKL
jgi:hypothetical protein